MPTAIKIQNLSKKYGEFQAVKNLNLEIYQGECFGLLGPNGAGKSTVITMLYGASPRTSGDIRVLDCDPATEGRKLKKQLGIVTQEDCLDEAMSVYENMQMFSVFLGIPPEKRAKRIDELLEFMSIKHRAKASIKALSGGMKRRLVFVRALLGDPKLIILDEPTTGLDPAVRQLIWERIQELKKRGASLILTTHYMDEAERLCDRLAIMDKGEVIALDTPTNLIQQFAPGFVANFTDDQRSAYERLKEADVEAKFYEDASGLNMRAPNLEMIMELCRSKNLEPKIIRPSNLEDVFLKLTGRELSSDA